MKTERLQSSPDASGQVVPDENQVYTFGDLRLETGTRQLTGPNGCHELSELTFSVLLTLIRHAPNVVTLDEFTEEAWERGFVSPENLIQRIKLLRKELGDDGKHPRLIKAVRGRGYRLAAEVQVESGGARPRDTVAGASVDRSQTSSSRTNRLLNLVLAILFILALATIYLVLDRSVLEPVRDAALLKEENQEAGLDALVETDSEHSIAVLPFKNLSGDPAQAYFSDGMAEELLNLLSQIPDLRVISRTSSFTFRDEDVDIPMIAEQLGVSHIIEGSVRKSEDRIRITAQLIDADSDSHLWSQTFERQLSDVFVLQDEISAAIVDGLSSATGLSVETVPKSAVPINTQAYDAYLRGKYLMKKRDPAELRNAIEEFALVVELEPEYARGHAQLAIAIGLYSVYGGVDLPDPKAQFLEHAERAFEIDPALAEAHLAMGATKQEPGELDQKMAYYESAIELNPNLALAHIWLSNKYRLTNRWNEALESALKAVQLDPLSSAAISNLYFDFIFRDRRIEAKQQLDKLSRLNPEWASELQAHFVALDGNWSDGARESLIGIQAGFSYPADEFLYCLAMLDLANDALIGLNAMSLDREAEAHHLDAQGGILYFSGSHEASVSAFEEAYAGQPSELESNLYYGLSLAGTGDYSRAKPVLDSVWSSVPGLSGLEHQKTEFVLAYVAARRESGDTEGVSELLIELKEDIEADEKAGLVGCVWSSGCRSFKRGVTAYLNGDREKGLASIEQSVDEGYFIIPNLAFLEFLYEDPGFAPIMEKQQARQAHEREKFLAVVCRDNPYADVWQPSEDTCATHLAGRNFFRIN